MSSAFREARNCCRCTKIKADSSGIGLRSLPERHSSCIRDTVCSNIRLRISDLDRAFPFPSLIHPHLSIQIIMSMIPARSERRKLREIHPPCIAATNFLTTESTPRGMLIALMWYSCVMNNDIYNFKKITLNQVTRVSII